MLQINFILILILVLAIFKYNTDYKNKHDNKSILQEKNVKNTVDDFSFIDDIVRFITDLFVF